MPKCYVIAGPNGAGKTTFALQFLPKIGCRNFVNADLIAAGLSPLSPERELVSASRIFIGEIKSFIARREDFAFETTLSGRTYLRYIERLTRGGWTVNLMYLALPSLEMSMKRVAERVSHGGHDIPERDLRRRFSRSLENLFLEYLEVVHSCEFYMNDGDVPALIFSQKGSVRAIADEANYTKIIEVINK